MNSSYLCWLLGHGFDLEAAEWERQDRMARPEVLNPQRQPESNEAMA